MVTAGLRTVIRRLMVGLGLLALFSTRFAAIADERPTDIADPAPSVSDRSSSQTSPSADAPDVDAPDVDAPDADRTPSELVRSGTTTNESAAIETSKDARHASELGPADDSSSPAPVKRKRLFERMSPLQRAKMILGLTSVLLLGGFLVFCAWFGARAARRYIKTADRARYRPTPLDIDDWARKPLVPPIDERKDGS